MSAGDAVGASGGDFFDLGDVVEHKMNTNVFGIVIGWQGSLVGMRVSPSLNILWFHEWELRHMEDDGEPVADRDETARGDNVINMATYKLRANTKTKGVA